MSFWGTGVEQDEADPQGRNPWDYVSLGGEELPGHCRITGAFARKVDVKLSPGRDGSTLTDLGYQPATIELLLTMWTEEHWATWERLLPRLRPRPGKGIGEALDIVHPATTAAGIRSVYITQVGLPAPGAVPGSMAVAISCIEYRKSTPTTTTTPRRSRVDIASQPTVVGPAQTPGADAPIPGPLYSENPWSGG